MALLANACASGPRTDSVPGVRTQAAGPVPKDLAVDRLWQSYADGYVFSVSYFTPAQVLSAEWERARMRLRGFATVCTSPRLARRDVRWFAPIAPGEPRCAMVIYSMACADIHPGRGASVAYGRVQALLQEPSAPPEAGCGEKSFAKRPPVVREPRYTDAATIDADARCDAPDDVTGSFAIGNPIYVNARTINSPGFVAAVGKSFADDPAQQLEYAATLGQKVHLLPVKRPLADDGANLFVDQSVATDGDGFCVTLTARQGSARWRVTKRGAFEKQDNRPGTRRLGPNFYRTVQLLQHDLARALGLASGPFGIELMADPPHRQ